MLLNLSLTFAGRSIVCRRAMVTSILLLFFLVMAFADDDISPTDRQWQGDSMPDEAIFDATTEDLDEYTDDFWSGLEMSVDLRNGYWRKRQSYLTEQPLSEARIQLEFDKDTDLLSYSIAADFIYDAVRVSNVESAYAVDLQNGDDWLDLRHLNISFTPIDFMDVKIGRQIVTWGTGDLIFINDLFPKDWNAFFIGRKDDYLKAPSDAIKLTLFHDVVNLDIVYTPIFDADRYVDGKRVSFYHPQLNRIAGVNSTFSVEQTDKLFASQEFALRAFRNLANYEFAAYAYQGYWKSPMGIDSRNAVFIFPRLSVLGASVRGPLFDGIVNIEFGRYRSGDDISGNNSLIPNSEFRGLLGYAQEVVSDLTASVQYYLRKKAEYNNYRVALVDGMSAEQEYRHEVSLRLTGMAISQKIVWTVFSLYAPRDEDGFIRSSVKYQQDDHWSYTLGGNLFFGESISTDNGQFQNNDNIYFALRFGY